MKLTIEIDPRAIEAFVQQRFDEAKDGCLCADCAIVTALVCAVLGLAEAGEI